MVVGVATVESHDAAVLSLINFFLHFFFVDQARATPITDFVFVLIVVNLAVISQAV